ncbi:MAG: DUF1015 domain-containing protein, partial [Deltaproteobacteria bacterium]|nr:DUF1015 domain-containing protein [Deltaproteobacteria bacterium]
NMAIVLPFRGIRYNTDRAGDMAQLIAPPYDVVDDEKRDGLVARNHYNIFSLELSKPDFSKTHKVDQYTCAKRKFESWLSEKILEQKDRHAIYPYDISFSTPGGNLCRKGFVALVRVEDWESRIVRPHERTFDRVTEDRFRLLQATEAQFSQVFILYRHSPDAASILAASEREELYTVKDEAGNTHKLWEVTDADRLKSLHECLQETVLYIADGHHRYATAIKYRNEMQKVYGKDPLKPYNYLMAYLVDAEDPGLVVLPVHRVVTLPEAMDPKHITAKASQVFDVEIISHMKDLEPEQLCNNLTQCLDENPQRRGVGVVFGKSKTAQVWWQKATDQNRLLSHLHPALSELDVMLLEEAVIKGVLKINPQSLKAGKTIKFTIDAPGAVKALDENDLLFILRPTSVNQVLDVADTGLIMPHKSTYFTPKILTGLIINSVDKNKSVWTSEPVRE